MKKIIPAEKIFPKNIHRILAAMLLILCYFSTEASVTKWKKNISGLNDTSVLINRYFKNTHYKVELAATSSPTKASITVSNIQKRSYQLYLFDTDGKLKAQIHIQNDENISLVNIEKGNYYYEILYNDELIENGQLDVK